MDAKLLVCVLVLLGGGTGGPDARHSTTQETRTHSGRRNATPGSNASSRPRRGRRVCAPVRPRWQPCRPRRSALPCESQRQGGCVSHAWTLGAALWRLAPCPGVPGRSDLYTYHTLHTHTHGPSMHVGGGRPRAHASTRTFTAHIHSAKFLRVTCARVVRGPQTVGRSCSCVRVRCWTSEFCYTRSTTARNRTVSGCAASGGAPRAPTLSDF